MHSDLFMHRSSSERNLDKKKREEINMTFFKDRDNFDTLSDYLDYQLNQTCWENGQVEDAQETASNATEAIRKLMILLVEKEICTEKELLEYLKKG